MAETIDELLAEFAPQYADKTVKQYEHVDIEARSYSKQTVFVGEQNMHRDAKTNALKAALFNRLVKALRDRVVNDIQKNGADATDNLIDEYYPVLATAERIRKVCG